MKQETQAVVIGGGIVGVAVLYHLTLLGWTDVVLVERKQLTAGSTWHAAAGFHSLNGSPNMARLQAYGINMYDRVAEISGQDVGMHRVGSVSCAATSERWDFLQMVQELNVTLGIESFLIGPEQVPEFTRIIDPGTLRGALVDLNDGYLDPYGATHAYAKAARMAGAEIYQQTLVTALEQRPDRSWDVVTERGTIHTQHVVNAAGLWAREVGQMVGLRLPLVPYEHHYLVTEPIPEIVAQTQESSVAVDLDGEIYVRQEQGGLLFGVYERGARQWATDGTPWTYGETQLLEPRLDDLAPTLERAFERFPLMQTAGIKNVINGPFTFTPDGNPLIGPVRGVPNYWVACGVMAGFSQCGGIALALSQWMVNGEPADDVFAMDIARFGDFATNSFTRALSLQFYESRFAVPYPNESWPAGRPLKTTPVYDLQSSAGAVFAPTATVETPMWFARPGRPQVDVPSFDRPNSFDSTAAEVAAATGRVGLADISSFSKFDISGPGARAWLDRLLATRIPTSGRCRLGVMTSETGRIIGDFTTMCLGDDHFVLTGSGPVQWWHMRWFDRFLPADGVVVRNVTDELSSLALIGPGARDLLSELTRTALDGDSFRLFDVREVEVALAPARVARLSLTGEFGYEISVSPMYLRHVYTAIQEAGTAHGLANVGALAMLSMRLEKSIGIWGREYSPDYTPAMNGMSRYVDTSKPVFVGRDRVLADLDTTPARRLVTLRLDATRSDATGFEPVYHGNRPVGYITSGGFGHRTDASLAMAYLDTDSIDPSIGYEVPILGERRPARVVSDSPYDPSGSRMRA